MNIRKFYVVLSAYCIACLSVTTGFSALHAAPAKTVKPAANAKGVAKSEKKNGRVQQIIRELGLSSTQTTKIEAIWKKSQADFAALNNNKTFNLDQKKARRQVIVADRMANIQKLLTPIQRQKLSVMIAEMKKKHGAK